MSSMFFATFENVSISRAVLFKPNSTGTVDASGGKYSTILAYVMKSNVSMNTS